MSKKTYWIIKVLPFYPESKFHFYCPKCGLPSLFVVPWDSDNLPHPKYCQYCGKRLYIRKEV